MNFGFVSNFDIRISDFYSLRALRLCVRTLGDFQVKSFIITFIFLFSLNLNLLQAEFISFYPNIKPLENYSLNLKEYLQGKNKSSKYYIVNDKVIFNNAKELLSAVQSQLIQFAIIPLRTLTILDYSNNIKTLLKKIYSLKNYNDGNLIPLKLELDNYGIFLISVLPGANYYLFTDFTDLKNIKKTSLSIALTNEIYFEKIKKIFPNTLIFNNLLSLNQYIKNKIFNSVIMTSIDYLQSGTKFTNLFDLNLGNEKYCFIVNKNYWDSLPDGEKLLFWSFNDKNRKLFYLDIKKFQDKILNNFTIKKLFQ